MVRQWCVLGLALAAMIGTATAAADVASASPGLSLASAASSVPSAASAVAPGHPMVRPGGLAVPGARRTVLHQGAVSTNWSGYAVSGGAGAYRSVSASWTVPAVACTSGNRYASFWVGLDGYGGHSRSVEQTGTDANCTGKTARYDGWYEMFPAAPVYFRTRVRPGDHLTASVTFSGTDTYTLVLKDITRGWSHSVVKDVPGLARSSAEVITEAPSSATGVLPLADFGSVRFAAAKVNGNALKGLHPIRIVMIDADRLVKDSTSAFGPAGAFRNTWIRSS
jgi:hypothetical protein